MVTGYTLLLRLAVRCESMAAMPPKVLDHLQKRSLVERVPLGVRCVEHGDFCALGVCTEMRCPFRGT